MNSRGLSKTTLFMKLYREFEITLINKSEDRSFFLIELVDIGNGYIYGKFKSNHFFDDTLKHDDGNYYRVIDRVSVEIFAKVYLDEKCVSYFKFIKFDRWGIGDDATVDKYFNDLFEEQYDNESSYDTHFDVEINYYNIKE